MPDKALPPLPYLIECPDAAIQDLELKFLDLHAQCVKRAEAEIKQAIAHRGAADICRFLINHRSDLIDLSKLVVDGKQRLLHFAEFRRSA